MDSLLQIPIGVPSLEAATAEVVQAIESGERQIVFACTNANAMNVSWRDDEFRKALQDADHVVADGVGVSVIARIAHKNVGPRISGQEYYEAVMNALSRRGAGRVFYFGSSASVLDRIRSRFAAAYPALTLCGAISPPFGNWSEEQNDAFIDEINAAEPDVLWVGMTAPKQEKWVYRNRRRLSVPVIGNVGAVFDFFAGTVKPAPAWVRKLGFEAVYRLAVEPRRLWRRVLVSNVNFIRLGLWHEVLRR
jgi:N-acetylglucosaminyldiphosphoundecaprenol N-acetyl-beta-D-mannosaminyltransferase